MHKRKTRVQWFTGNPASMLSGARRVEERVKVIQAKQQTYGQPISLAKKVFCAAILGAMLSAIGKSANAQEFGPIETRNHRALSLMFLRMPTNPGILAPRQRRWETGLTLANDFRILTGLTEDYEVQRLQLKHTWGLEKGREVWVELPLMNRGGGLLDEIVNFWHINVLRQRNPLRENTPSGGRVVRLAGSHDFGSATGIGDITAGFGQKLSPRTAFRAAIKLPTGDSSKILGSGGLDAGAAFYYTVPIQQRWTFYVMAGFIAQSPARRVASTRGLIDQEMLSLVYQPNSKDAWTLQWNSERAPVQTGVAGVDATHRLISLGYQRKLGRNELLELFFSEDRDLFFQFPEGWNVGPDFTFGLRYQIRF